MLAGSDHGLHQVGDVAIWSASALAALGILWRATKGPRSRLVHLLREARNAVYDIRGFEMRNPRTGEITHIPGSRERFEYLEGQFQTNGGETLRDVVNAVHGFVKDNNDRHTRLEENVAAAWRRANDAAVLSGEAAQVAARADQGVRELKLDVIQRHAENVQRLTTLEESAHDTNILRQLLLSVLRDQHGIDLLPDEEDDTQGDDTT